MLFWLLAALAGWLFLRWLTGADLSGFDRGHPDPQPAVSTSAERAHIAERVTALITAADSGSLSLKRVPTLRKVMDGMGEGASFSSRFEAVEQGLVRGEWVLGPEANPQKRLLYIHGGGFFAGSPRSHRLLTDALAVATGMAIFSLEYRLLPEANQKAAIRDVDAALKWLSVNGPSGDSSAATHLVVAGDSAGGNLTLSCLQRARDKTDVRIDAAIAFCPSSDITLASPSFRYNLDSDLILGKSLRPVLAIPSFLRLIVFFIINRRRPSHPTFSPLRGSLSGLPPTLLQASTTELLLDDSARYYHKAKAAGSAVEFETYRDMVHVWQLFSAEIREGRLAIANVVKFLERVGVLTQQDQRFNEPANCPPEADDSAPSERARC
jgi:acetyl esterase/lipase